MTTVIHFWCLVLRWILTLNKTDVKKKPPTMYWQSFSQKRLYWVVHHWYPKNHIFSVYIVSTRNFIVWLFWCQYNDDYVALLGYCSNDTLNRQWRLPVKCWNRRLFVRNARNDKINVRDGSYYKNKDEIVLCHEYCA